MEVDFCHGSAVGMALRLGDQAVYLQDIAAHSLRQIKLIDDLSDVLQISVDMRMGMTVGMLMVMVRMIMLMAVAMVMAGVVSVLMMLVRMGVYVQTLLFLSADCHFQMGSADPAFFNRFLFKGHSGNTQGIQSVNHGGRIGIEFQQGCGEHISGRPHVTFKI